VLISGAEDSDATGPVPANACWVAVCNRESDILQYQQRAGARERGCLVQERRILRDDELGSSAFLRGASGAARTPDHVTAFPAGPAVTHNNAFAGMDSPAYPSTPKRSGFVPCAVLAGMGSACVEKERASRCKAARVAVAIDLAH
jgi:hypothetical protein